MVETPPTPGAVADGPFDPARAVFGTRVVAVGRVADLLHVSHDPDGIRRYRDAMLRGERFPPVSVIALPGRYVIADGHRRFQAFLGLGADELLVEVWPLRALAADLWRQHLHFLRRGAAAMRSLARGRSGREEAWRFLRQLAGHWLRIARSLFRSPLR